MKSIAAPDAAEKDLAKYGLDKPELTATVGAGSTRATLAVGKADESGNALRPRRWPARWSSPSTPSLVDDLQKHRRQLPAEGRLRVPLVHRHPPRGRRAARPRSPSNSVTGKDGTTKWQRLNPAKDVESAEMDALLSAFSGLSVDSYVDAGTKTGADAPVAVVTAKFDDGKKEERVVFGRVGSDVFAMRAGEPGAAKVDAAKFDDAMKALDAIK